ncbi:unnamed protein product [Tilletia laevis]|nr:hypothetical protein CF335_g6597 [Tilletia laevis]KAE8201757.1 hypothetical protein CF328_g2588 [Tilletia controversa]CAD6901442.1 unnamed protein product [Tilletia laevis]CAD6915054.1 unnamed protein product [Tilletia laevis]
MKAPASAAAVPMPASVSAPALAAAASSIIPDPPILEPYTCRDRLLLAQATYEAGAEPPDWTKISMLLLSHPLIKDDPRAGATVSSTHGSAGGGTAAQASNPADEDAGASQQQKTTHARARSTRSRSAAAVPPPSASDPGDEEMKDEDTSHAPSSPIAATAGTGTSAVAGSAPSWTPADCERAWTALIVLKGLGGEQAAQVVEGKLPEKTSQIARADRSTQLLLARILYSDRMLELKAEIEEKDDLFRSIISQVEEERKAKSTKSTATASK